MGYRNRVKLTGQICPENEALTSKPTIQVMKTRIAINLFLLAVIFRTANLYADWKTDWEQTVAAAKKEARLNLYVGRYGQAALLDEFKKDYPEIIT